MDAKVMTVVQLAKQLGLDKSNVLKKVRKRRLTILKVQRITASGALQWVCAVPESDALAIIKEYQEARSAA